MTAPEQAESNCGDFEVSAYVEQMAQLLGVSLPESIKPQVVENFVRVMTIAQPVLEFELPATIEPASTFEP